MLLSNFFLLYPDYWKLLRIVHVMSINGKTISGTPNSARSSVLWTILNLLLVFSESWDNRATNQLDSKNSCLQEEVEASTLIHMGVNTEGRQTAILGNWEELSYLKKQKNPQKDKSWVRETTKVWTLRELPEKVVLHLFIDSSAWTFIAYLQQNIGERWKNLPELWKSRRKEHICQWEK